MEDFSDLQSIVDKNPFITTINTFYDINCKFCNKFSDREKILVCYKHEFVLSDCVLYKHVLLQIDLMILNLILFDVKSDKLTTVHLVNVFDPSTVTVKHFLFVKTYSYLNLREQRDTKIKSLKLTIISNACKHYRTRNDNRKF